MKFGVHFDDISIEALKNRVYVAEIARPFLGSDSTDSRRARYQQYWERFDPNVSMEDADLAALPMSWNYYVETGQVRRAERFVARAEKAGKLCVVFGMGDRKPQIHAKPIIIFGTSLYRSRTHENPQYAIPSIFPDILNIQSIDDLPIRHKGEKPVVGFCGQAATPLLQVGRLWLKNVASNLIEKLGQAKYEAPPVSPHLLLRRRALEVVKAHSGIETNFLIRDRYLGSGTSPAPVGSIDPRQQFLQNIADSDYTICVRGAGNFSKRFYEVLCLGRIPVFVNTDCILPYEFEINWKKYCVWVEEDEIDHIGDKIVQFHNSLSNDDFVDLQRRCRQLWVDRLTQNGFMMNFPRHFS